MTDRGSGAPDGGSGKFRRVLLAVAGYASILAATVVLLLAIEGSTRLYAAIFGNPLEVRHGFAPTRTWPDPGISSPEFHALVSDRYHDFGSYYAYSGFPEPDDIPWTDFPVHINRFGLRGAEFELDKAPGSFRIVTMGESSTFGFMVDDAQTYPVRLQEIFDQRLGAGRIEVINAGLPYYTTEDMSILLHQLVARMNPDLVTFYIGYNDATWLTRTLLERRMRENAGRARALAKDLRALLVGSSLFVNKLARSVDAQLRAFTIADETFPPLTRREGEELLAAVTDEFSHRVRTLHRQACALEIDHVFAVQLHAPLNMWSGAMQSGDDPFEFLVPRARGGDYYTYAAAMRDKLDDSGFDKPVEVFWFAHYRINEWLLAQPSLRALDFVRRVAGDWSHLATLIHLNATGNEELARFLADSLQDAIVDRDTSMIRARCDTP